MYDLSPNPVLKHQFGDIINILEINLVVKVFGKTNVVRCVIYNTNFKKIKPTLFR